MLVVCGLSEKVFVFILKPPERGIKSAAAADVVRPEEGVWSLQ